MALTQPSNVTPSSFSGIGKNLNTVAASDNVKIGWQVNGLSPMVSFCFTVYNNTGIAAVDALAVYRSDLIAQSPAFYGTDRKGDPAFFEYEPTDTTWYSLGLRDGGEYKLQITQFWTGPAWVYTATSGMSTPGYFLYANGKYLYVLSDMLQATDVLMYDADRNTLGKYTTQSGSLKGFTALTFTVFPTKPPSDVAPTFTAALEQNRYCFVQQTSDSAFLCRTDPTVSISYFSTPVTTVNKSFSATFSQAQGDYLQKVRWILTNVSSGQIIEDTGYIDTGLLKYVYDGFLAGNTYRLNVYAQTQNGVEATDIQTFSVSYQQSPVEEEITMCCTPDNAVLLRFSADETPTQPQFALYRTENGVAIPFGTFPVSVTAIKDYGARALGGYQYSVYFLNNDETYSDIIQTQTVKPVFRAYTLIEATEDSELPNVYHAVRAWRFGNNLSAGAVSNNNSPTFLSNFTRTPLRQKTAQAPKSGTLSALISNVNSGAYADTAEQMEELYAISLSENTFFLKDMKGNLYMVHTSGAISQQINTRTGIQEVSFSLPWQEVGDTDGIALVQTNIDPGWEE